MLAELLLDELELLELLELPDWSIPRSSILILPILFFFPYSKYVYYLNLENHMRHFLNFLFFWKWSLFLCKTKEIICWNIIILCKTNQMSDRHFIGSSLISCVHSLLCFKDCRNFLLSFITILPQITHTYSIIHIYTFLSLRITNGIPYRIF